MSRDLILTPEDVAEIVAILDGGAYDRLELSTSRFVLRVARDGPGWTQEWDWNVSVSAEAVAVVEVAAVVDDGRPAIRAPLPGTFYRAPAPGAPPFVQVGDRLAPDSVIGIIETMKLMNSVHAGVSGVVEAFLVENGVMVANGQALVVVGPA